MCLENLLLNSRCPLCEGRGMDGGGNDTVQEPCENCGGGGGMNHVILVARSDNPLQFACPTCAPIGNCWVTDRHIFKEEVDAGKVWFCWNFDCYISLEGCREILKHVQADCSYGNGSTDSNWACETCLIKEELVEYIVNFKLKGRGPSSSLLSRFD